MARARPLQAASASAAAFAVGSVVPIVTIVLSPTASIGILSSVTAIGTLLLLGGMAAWAGGASVVRGAVRVAFWGAFAMALTSFVGSLFGAKV
jgi:VIT1/CCC1 family predicted Fe2+/Mn2+ transporter